MACCTIFICLLGALVQVLTLVIASKVDQYFDNNQYGYADNYNIFIDVCSILAIILYLILILNQCRDQSDKQHNLLILIFVTMLTCAIASINVSMVEVLQIPKDACYQRYSSFFSRLDRCAIVVSNYDGTIAVIVLNYFICFFIGFINICFIVLDINNPLIPSFRPSNHPPTSIQLHPAPPTTSAAIIVTDM